MSRTVSGILLAKLVAASRKMAQPLRELGGCASAQCESPYDENDFERHYFAELSEIDELEEFSLYQLRVCQEMRRYTAEKQGEDIPDDCLNQPGEIAGAGRWDSNVVTLANALSARLTTVINYNAGEGQRVYFGPRELYPHQEIRERLPLPVCLAIKDLHMSMRDYVSARQLLEARTSPTMSEAAQSILGAVPSEPEDITADQASAVLSVAASAEWHIEDCRRALDLFKEGLPKKSREVINRQRVPSI